mgnify:CR=1 FL=1
MRLLIFRLELIEVLNVENDQVDIINNHSFTVLFL